MEIGSHTLNNMLGCSNPNLGKIWTNHVISILTQLQLSLPTVHFFIAFSNPTFGFAHIRHKFGLKQHFLECIVNLKPNKMIYQLFI